MKALLIYRHQCKENFTVQVKEAFLKGLTDAGHCYEILY